jgi:hypothetical protein
MRKPRSDKGLGASEGLTRLAALRDDVVPTDEERLELVVEALRGARWLLLLAQQGLDGSHTVKAEAQKLKRGLDIISDLCTSLRPR